MEETGTNNENILTSGLPSSVFVQFVTNEMIDEGPPLNISVSTKSSELEDILNGLLSNDERLPYTFYIDNVELSGSIEEFLNVNSVSTEGIMRIIYQNLSIFRVRPVTRCTDTLTGHNDAVLHVAFSPDGSRLASGGGDGEVRFWDPETCTPLQVCSGHRHHVLCTAWSPDSEIFASADKAGEIRLWNASTGEAIGSPMRGHSSWITCIAWEPLHCNKFCNRFITSSKDTTLRIWNSSTCLSECCLSGHLDAVECVKWGGLKHVYSASRDRTVKIWFVNPANNGTTSGRESWTAVLLRTLTGHALRVNSIALNVDFACRAGAFPLGSDFVNSTREEKYENAKRSFQSVLAAGNGYERLCSCSDDLTLILWKIDCAPPQASKHRRTGEAKELSDVEEDFLISRMSGHQQLVNQISFSADGRYIASASFDKKIKIWCGLTGKFLATLGGHVASVYQVTWSPDSRWVASASKDSTNRIWSAKDICKPKEEIVLTFPKDEKRKFKPIRAKPTPASHTSLSALAGHCDEVYALDWSPNGMLVASGSKDRTVKIWRN